MTASALHPLSQANPNGYRDIAPTVALEHLDGFVAIDVREPDEYTGPLGHIDGAALVPLSTVGRACNAWDKDKPLLIICRSGGRSGSAAAALIRAGFRDVYNLTGGMLAWNDLELPVAGEPSRGAK